MTPKSNGMVTARAYTGPWQVIHRRRWLRVLRWLEGGGDGKLHGKRYVFDMLHWDETDDANPNIHRACILGFATALARFDKSAAFLFTDLARHMGINRDAVTEIGVGRGSATAAQSAAMIRNLLETGKVDWDTVAPL